MDETYRMLGREHQADLDREAARCSLASRLPHHPRNRFALLSGLVAVARALVGVARRRVRAAPTT